jgi:hypothetical protein
LFKQSKCRTLQLTAYSIIIIIIRIIIIVIIIIIIVIINSLFIEGYTVS